MMKIGVISDTHLTGFDKRLERIAETYFSDVEVIFHAGDIVDIGVLDVFKEKEIYAVCGNMDLHSVRKTFPQKMTLEIGGYRIGLIHGWGTPFGIEEKLIQQFDNIDCLVYGHTHQAVNRVKDNVLYFNPGSPTDIRFAHNNTIGILQIDDAITGETITIEDKR
jgi:putative phosphoesterase